MRDGRNVMRAGPFLHAWSERELARPVIASCSSLPVQNGLFARMRGLGVGDTVAVPGAGLTCALRG